MITYIFRISFSSKFPFHISNTDPLSAKYIYISPGNAHLSTLWQAYIVETASTYIYALLLLHRLSVSKSLCFPQVYTSTLMMEKMCFTMRRRHDATPLNGIQTTETRDHLLVIWIYNHNLLKYTMPKTQQFAPSVSLCIVHL